jgi:twitching motility protein PilI
MSVQVRENLRDFQNRLAQKLEAAQANSGATSKLGVIAGGRHWLVSLDQVNEVVTVPQLAEVPWSKPWFVGVASVRGVVYGCVDLAAYAGIAEPLPKGESRLLLVHPRFGVNAALRVERALGLRTVKELAPEAAAADAPDWVLGRWRAPDGEFWTEISMEKLVSTPAFLEAGA